MTPSIRKAFVHTLASLAAAISLLERTPRAKKAAPSDKMFDQMITDYKAALEQGRAALAAPPQDVVEGIVSLLKENIRIQVYGDDATAQIRDDNLTLCATAILASGLVTVTHPDESAIRADERERCAKIADDRWREWRSSYEDDLDGMDTCNDIAAAIRVGGAK